MMQEVFHLNIRSAKRIIRLHPQGRSPDQISATLHVNNDPVFFLFRDVRSTGIIALTMSFLILSTFGHWKMVIH
jgi:hypothetical protein